MYGFFFFFPSRNSKWLLTIKPVLQTEGRKKHQGKGLVPIPGKQTSSLNPQLTSRHLSELHHVDIASCKGGWEIKLFSLTHVLIHTYMQSTSRETRLDEAQTGIKIAGRNINNRYIDDTTLMAESEEELKSLLMKVREETGKVDLKLSIQKTKIMLSGPITSWQIDGETVETVADFILGGSKITADGDCSHEIKTRLLLGRKVMTNLDSILKSRDITLSIKVC